MFPKLSRDKNTKDYEKLIRNLQKIIENHPYNSSLKFSSLELRIGREYYTWNSSKGNKWKAKKMHLRMQPLEVNPVMIYLLCPW
jgi:hypothetical protein